MADVLLTKNTFSYSSYALKYAEIGWQDPSSKLFRANFYSFNGVSYDYRVGNNFTLNSIDPYNTSIKLRIIIKINDKVVYDSTYDNSPGSTYCYFDGSYGTPSIELYLANSLPTTPSLSVSGQFKGGGSLSFSLSGSTDSDGDTISYDGPYYSWDNSNWVQATSLIIPNDKNKTLLYVRGRAYDGYGYSPYATKTFAISQYPKIFTKINGNFFEYNGGYVKINGTWVAINEVYVKINGSWIKSQ